MMPYNQDAHEIAGDYAIQNRIRKAVNKASAYFIFHEPILFRIEKNTIDCRVNLGPQSVAQTRPLPVVTGDSIIQVSRGLRVVLNPHFAGLPVRFRNSR
jgi:hypothetical protein